MTKKMKYNALEEARKRAEKQYKKDFIDKKELGFFDRLRIESEEHVRASLPVGDFKIMKRVRLDQLKNEIVNAVLKNDVELANVLGKEYTILVSLKEFSDMDFEKLYKNITNKFEAGKNGIISVAKGKKRDDKTIDAVYIYVEKNKDKKRVLSELKAEELPYIEVVVSGKILPAED